MICVVFFIYIVFYCVKNYKDTNLLKSRFSILIKATFLGIGLSAFFLAPMLEQMASQTFLVNRYSQFYNINEATSFKDVLFRQFINFENYYSNGTNNCIFNLGYIFYFGQFIYLYVLTKNKGKTSVTFSFILSNISVLFSLGLALTFGILSNLNVIHFAFRFNIISLVLLTHVITYSLTQITLKTRNIFMIIIVVYSCINMALVFHYDFINDDHCYNNQTYYEPFSKSTHNEAYDWLQISNGEYLPVNDVYQYKLDDSSLIKIVEDDRYNYYEACNVIDGKTIPVEYKRNGTKISFSYTSNYDLLMMVPLTYYKGYSVYVIDFDGNLERLEYEDIGRYKQVAF